MFYLILLLLILIFLIIVTFYCWWCCRYWHNIDTVPFCVLLLLCEFCPLEIKRVLLSSMFSEHHCHVQHVNTTPRKKLQCLTSCLQSQPQMHHHSWRFRSTPQTQIHTHNTVSCQMMTDRLSQREHVCSPSCHGWSYERLPVWPTIPLHPWPPPLPTLPFTPLPATVGGCSQHH